MVSVGEIEVRPAREATPFELAQDLLCLGGERFDLTAYPYLKAVYNTRASRVGLFTGRQVAKCVAEGSLITRADGTLVKVEDLKPGESVVCVDVDWKSTTREIQHVFDNGQAECLKIKTRSGAVLVVTPNHRLLTARGYVEAKDLVRGSSVATAESGGRFESRRPPGGVERIKSTAYMIGDGCCGLSGNWNFTSNEAECLAEMRDISGAGTRVYEKPKTTAKSMCFSRLSPVVVWAREDGLAGKYSYEKSVPAWVFSLSANDTALFLSRLWATDGSIYQNNQTVTSEYCSTSELLARQVQSLLRKLQIRSTLRSSATSCKGKAGKRAYKVRLVGYDALLRFYRVVGKIPGKPPIYTTIATERRNTLVTMPPETLSLLKEAYEPLSCIPKRIRGVGIHAYGLKWPRDRLSREKFARWLTCYRELGLNTDRLSPLLEGSVWWDTITSVKRVGVRRVYDLEVEGEHNYLLDTGIVSHNSTTLASKLVLNAVCHPGSVQVFVAPLQEQAMVFAQQRLRDFIAGSPIIQDCFFDGPGKIDQVLRRVFNAGNSMITLGYAQRTADRLRGQSVKDGKMQTVFDPNTGELIEVGGAQLTFDEIQDIMPEVYPVVEEMAFRAKSPRFWYCGTPKSMNNPMEGMRSRSTGAEWGVRCQAMGCKKWNLSWTEKNIGNTGVICEFCGAALNTNADGRWIVARKMDLHRGRDATVTMETYRVPQLIVKPVMDRRVKWLELLEKLRTYSSEKFRNEVLGLPHDSGSVPVTLEQLRACCDDDRPNRVPNPNRDRYPPLVMGVDWAFNGENSYTFVSIGGYNPFPGRYDVYYWKIFKGIETDPLYQIDWIVKAASYAGVQLLGCDWGCGQVQNLQLINRLGDDRVIQMWHTGMQGTGGARAARAKWEPKTRKWHLARTRVLTDVFEMVRTRQISFPKSSDCQELFDHFLAVSLEYNDKTNTQRYVNVKPDDGLHSVCYGTIAGEFLVRGDFKGHMGSTTTTDGATGDLWNEIPNAATDSLYH